MAITLMHPGWLWLLPFVVWVWRRGVWRRARPACWTRHVDAALWQALRVTEPGTQGRLSRLRDPLLWFVLALVLGILALCEPLLSWHASAPARLGSSSGYAIALAPWLVLAVMALALPAFRRGWMAPSARTGETDGA